MREQVGIIAQRFGAFHGEEKRDPALGLCLLNFRKRLAEDEARRGFQFRLEQRDLIQRHAQRVSGQVFVLDVKRDAEQADVARFKLGQKICRDDRPPRAAQEKTKRQIEMQVDQSLRMEARDSFFDLVS